MPTSKGKGKGREGKGQGCGGGEGGWRGEGRGGKGRGGEGKGKEGRKGEGEYRHLFLYTLSTECGLYIGGCHNKHKIPMYGTAYSIKINVHLV